MNRQSRNSIWPLNRRGFDRIGVVLNRRFQVEQVADPLDAGVQLSKRVPFLDDPLGRLEHILDVLDEGGQQANPNEESGVRKIS